MASTNLSKAQGSGAAINKFTLSMWVKRSVDTAGRLFSATGSSGDVYFRFNGDATMEWSGDASNASSAGYFITNRKFEDYFGWYHLVIRFDSTQGSAGSRLRFYVNGVLEESFSSYTDVNQNAVDKINLSGNTHYIGGTVSSQYFHGLMSHVNYSAGYSYAPTEFGETDSTTGEWKIKVSPSINYGTNGYFILKDGATLTDSSSNSNNFAVANGTLTKTLDCPSNVFSTLNPLYVVNAAQMPTLTNGNTTGTSTATGYNAGVASIAPAGSGKFYSEHKLISGTGGWATNTYLGYNQTPSASYASAPHDTNFFYGVLADGGAREGATNKGGYAGTWTSGDIIQLALDLDNNKLYVGKNGQWADGSGNWDEANINAFINLAASPAVAGQHWYLMCGDKNTSTATWGNNFGNGFFATTEISSDGTAASTPGRFEYDVPTGFQPLSTKGLNA